jgi:lipopolysaccharide/colanic/teichoic acid biosynthesis glycosyltransferase
MDVAPTRVDLEHPAWALAVKRGCDIGVSLLLLLVLWPVLLVVAVAVKLSTPGPILYRGVRSGLHGTTFRILKFRTMVEHAESLGGPTTGTNDRRVTRLGAALRRSKLDELPQLWNVLVGDMSLVGPRPEVLEYTALYQGEGARILSMRPGITDYASIEFADLDDRVGSVDPDKYFRERVLPRKIALRIRYVKEWSLVSDAAIVWATVRRLVKRIFVR